MTVAANARVVPTIEGLAFLATLEDPPALVLDELQGCLEIVRALPRARFGQCLRPGTLQRALAIEGTEADFARRLTILTASVGIARAVEHDPHTGFVSVVDLDPRGCELPRVAAQWCTRVTRDGARVPSRAAQFWPADYPQPSTTQETPC